MKYKIFYSAKKYLNSFNKNNILLNFKERIKWMAISLIILRIGSFIPIYGINLSLILDKLINNNKSNIIINMFNLFSGGSLSRMSVFSLGIMPYISSSILIHILSIINPYFIKLKKSGDESSKSLINKYTFLFTIIFSIIHSFLTIINLQNLFLTNINIINLNFYKIIFSMLSLISGTMFLMWLSEQITNYGIGNGVSVIIFTGIISNIPKYIKYIYLELINKNINITTVLFVLIITYILIYITVFIECSQRKIIVNYPKQYFFGKNLLKSSSSYLPIKINIAGVMPAIFAISFMIFPTIIFNFLGNYFDYKFLIKLSILFQSGNIIYILFYTLLIFLFCFIYSPLIFNIKETSDNLKKSNAYIYGIRPGIKTSEYIEKIINKLTFIGALYISFICLVPEILKYITGFIIEINGTSLLIVTIVIIEIITQIKTIIISTKYESILKKMNIK